MTTVERTDARQLSLDTDAALRASRALVAIAARSMGVDEDVTTPQFRALVILTSRGPTSSGELATQLHVERSTLTRMVDRLVRKDLVRRIRNEDDRRAVHVEITDTGIEIVRAVSSARRRELSAVLRRIPASRRRSIVVAFDEFAEAAGEPASADWFTVLDLATHRAPARAR
jgi:DNA-binding MarR family transcriptional regulator